jgi:hypothetical protein
MLDTSILLVGGISTSLAQALRYTASVAAIRTPVILIENWARFPTDALLSAHPTTGSCPAYGIKVKSNHASH